MSNYARHKGYHLDGIGYDISGFIEDWVEGMVVVLNNQIQNIKLYKLDHPYRSIPMIFA